jgi:tetratricopeptide (TPR) repeat protein
MEKPMTHFMKSALTSLALGAMLTLSPLANALPSGTTEPAATTPKPASPKKLKCKRNETAKPVTKNGKTTMICKKLSANLLSDQDLYQQARLLADEGEYEWALNHLMLSTNLNDPAVLTLIGYAHRKAGRLETGMAYYDQALQQNPDLAETREYLGEAFILAGYRGKAEQQLQIIQSICGTTCVSYQALQFALQETQ